MIQELKDDVRKHYQEGIRTIIMLENWYDSYREKTDIEKVM